jgi:hypothetical protein
MLGNLAGCQKVDGLTEREPDTVSPSIGENFR